uniref:CRAL-TRIO domain-containing protein n=1 Tax=Pectinophora gossypiella TaxID=13191 RepID=A0A1E1WUN0_PECGO
MPVSVRPLCPELAEKARVELNEDPKKLEDGIQILKDWIAKQPHLRARTDDQWLATFLRGCKFSIERAKEKIDLYYSLRSVGQDLRPLKHTDPKFKEILKSGSTLVLRKIEKPDDPRVILIRPGQHKPGEFTPADMMSVGNVMQQILYLEDDNFVVAGGVNVMDLRSASMAHFAQMTPVQMKKMVVAFQDAAPVRMKAAHYFHAPAGFETIFNIIKNFLNEKNRNRLHVHGKDFDALYKHISKEILPAEYGGNGGTIQEITGTNINIFLRTKIGTFVFL